MGLDWKLGLVCYSQHPGPFRSYGVNKWGIIGTRWRSGSRNTCLGLRSLFSSGSSVRGLRLDGTQLSWWLVCFRHSYRLTAWLMGALMADGPSTGIEMWTYPRTWGPLPRQRTLAACAVKRSWKSRPCLGDEIAFRASSLARMSCGFPILPKASSHNNNETTVGS